MLRLSEMAAQLLRLCDGKRDETRIARAFARRSDSGEMSIEVIRASGLFRARMTVWAPTPHPASSTSLPGG